MIIRINKKNKIKINALMYIYLRRLLDTNVYAYQEEFPKKDDLLRPWLYTIIFFV